MKCRHRNNFSTSSPLGNNFSSNFSCELLVVCLQQSNSFGKCCYLLQDLNLEDVTNSLAQLGTRVVAFVSDNGANMLRAIKDRPDAFGLTCFAHSGNLLMKDLASIWTDIFSKAECLAQFFQNCHYAMACYREEMEK
eukprot:EG_transcript_24071